MKNSVNYHIRPGRRDDIPQILDLVKALAEYERLADQVSASENLYEKHGFGAEPRFQTLVVESGTGEGPFLGFALYFFTFSTFLGRPSLYLEDLFVRPEFRGIGIGKVLLSELAKIAQRNDCGRMEWAVLNWNESAIQFYKSLGAKAMNEWTVYRLTEPEIHKLAKL